MALTSNQLTVGLLGAAVGGYKTTVVNFISANGTTAAADALLSISALNPKIMGAPIYNNQKFAEMLSANFIGTTSAAVQAGVSKIIVDFMAANPTYTRGAVAVALIEALEAVPLTDPTLGASRAAFEAKVAKADAYTGTSTDLTALAQVIGEAAPNVGQTYTLTNGQDGLTGTAFDDTFNGFVHQNQNGANANSLSTGDVIDGGAGTDTIVATLINDRIIEGATQLLDLNVRTSNVEIVKLEVLDEQVRVDAGNMDSVQQYWSVNSDDSGLILEDVRLGSKLAVTKDITFGMKDVDYESDLTAMFDSNSLRNAGSTTSNSQILIEVGYEDAPSDVSNTNPTKDLFVKVSFTHNGKTFDSGFLNTSLTSGAYPDTYTGLKDLLKASLISQGFSNLTVEFGTDISSIVTGAGTKPLQVTAKQIYIKDPAGKAFSAVTSSAGANSSDPTSDVASRILPIDPSTATTLIESNLILDNAGRGSTAGDVQIGAMSNSNAGVEKFNVMVDRSSAIESLTTTNGKLKEIAITSLAAKGDMEMGWTQSGLNLIDASTFAGANLMLGTTVEGGRAAVENEAGGGSVTTAPVENLKTLSANIAGNVTFIGSSTEAALTSSGKAYSYTTGSGNDKITYALDGDSVDSNGESFTINAGSGSNTVSVELEDQTTVSYTTMAGLKNMSIVTGSGADKITNSGVGLFNITAGAGSDFVVIESRNDADVDGVGADQAGNATTGQWLVSVTDEDASIPLATFVDRVLYQAKLTVNFAGFESQVAVQTTSATNFVATQLDINAAIMAAVAANPELTKLLSITQTTDMKGLTIKSTVEGLNDFTIDLFQPELVTAVVPTATQVLVAAGDVNALRSGLITTLDMGVADSALVADDSAQVVAVTDIINVFNGVTAIVSGTTGDGYLTATGAVAAPNDQTSAFTFLGTGVGTDGTNETNIENFSVINMGTGTNDLVVLNSDNTAVDGDDAGVTVTVSDAVLSTNVAQFSVNKLVFNANWDKVSVVNFFTNQSNGTDGLADNAEGEMSDATVGSHVLDFTYWLDDKIDTSTTPTGNSESTQRVATTARVDVAATLDVTVANEVIVVNDFVAGTAGTANATETWANLTAATLKMALEGTTQGTDTAYGNIAVAADAAVANTADDNIDGIVDVATATDTAKIDSIFMIENDANQGEYKVFNVEWSNIDNTSGTGSIEDATVTLVGVIDFGESIGTAISYTSFSSNFA